MRFSVIFIFILIIAGLALIAYFASPKKERYKKKYKNPYRPKKKQRKTKTRKIKRTSKNWTSKKKK